MSKGCEIETEHVVEEQGVGGFKVVEGGDSSFPKKVVETELVLKEEKEEEN